MADDSQETPLKPPSPFPPGWLSDGQSAATNRIIQEIENRKRQLIAANASGQGAAIFNADVQKARPAPRTEIGTAVLHNINRIEVGGWSFVVLIDERIAALERLNTDEAHALIAEYKDLKRRVEEFLGATSAFAANTEAEQPVVTAATLFTEGLKNIWANRHLVIADMGLLAIGVLVCEMAHPLSVVVAGTIVGGKNVVDAIKAAMGRDQ